ncbi:MAG: hypothetical protein Q9N62_01610 [Ghiorsea sp.]|nr:hypothetical protein [Ghiorsea sp.]
MSYETKFVLKSFIQFISNDFKLPSFKNKASFSVLNIDGLEKGLCKLKLAHQNSSGFYIGFSGGVKALRGSNLGLP